MDIRDYGYRPGEALPQGIPARVTAVHRERYEIVCEYGMLHARLKAREYYMDGETFPTTGDFVAVQVVPDGDSLIVATLPRRTLFTRREAGPVPCEQAVAANFDYVFILQSLNMDFNPKRLERYMTLAWQSGAMPVVLLTKADLVIDPLPYVLEAQRCAAGADVRVISTHSGLGMEQLRAYLTPGKTAVFLGSSGVGKSSLVNALAGKEIMSVSGIREDDSKGRHTTTHRQLIRLDSGAMIIDTPGMRELGMLRADDALADAFADVEPYLGKCRFSDCAHRSEPGCAIRAAIRSGDLDIRRWESYCKLRNEAADRAEMLRRKQAWSKGVAKANKQRKKDFRS